MRAKIEEAKPKAHLFGHLHEQRGYWIWNEQEEKYIGGVEYMFYDGVRNDILPPVIKTTNISLIAVRYMSHRNGIRANLFHATQ